MRKQAKQLLLLLLLSPPPVELLAFIPSLSWQIVVVHLKTHTHQKCAVDLITRVNVANGNVGYVDGNGQMTGASIRDGWLESNVGDGCNISAPNVLLSGLRVVDYHHDGRAVRLDATAVGAVVHGIRSGGNGNYSDFFNVILVEGLDSNSSSSLFDFAGNFNMYGVSPMQVAWSG